MNKRAEVKAFSQDITADFNKTATDYAKYRQGFPEEFFNRLEQLNVCDYGARVLDIGTGTGSIARGMAQLGYDTYAIDLSDGLIEEAKKLDQLINVNVEYSVASAEKTGFDSNAFDLIMAGQCWHWFNQEKAIKEIKRIARPHAKLIIAHFDWLPLKDSVPKITEQLIKKHNTAWNLDNGTGFYPEWAMQLAEHGLRNIETYTFTKDRYYTHEAWRGRVKASAGIAASMAKEKITAFDQDLEQQLQANFPEATLTVPHRCFTLIADI